MKTFIIAEAGVNHNGDEALGLELIEVAARCKADAVKFQSFKADKLVRKGAAKAEYQRRETGEGDQHSMLRGLEISEQMHHVLMDRCKTLGIEFMSTPFDAESADFLVHMGMKRLKVPSGEITNHPFLEDLAAKNLPIILSTGMSTLEDIREAVQVIADVRERLGYAEPLARMLTILHCTSNYPAATQDVNLNVIPALREALQLPVGYSDHTEGTVISAAAVALGAVVVEKHFTLDRSLPGPDHKASLEPSELADLIRYIRDVEVALGSSVKQPTPSELPVRDIVRRSVTLKRNMRRGEVLGREDLILLRPGDGIPPKELEAVIGRRVARDLNDGHTLQWSDLD